MGRMRGFKIFLENKKQITLPSLDLHIHVAALQLTLFSTLNYKHAAPLALQTRISKPSR
jgi:hypothetical protein